jgi:hypothetical protein
MGGMVLRSLLVATALAITACEQCSQDYSPPTHIDTTSNPYPYFSRTTNTDLERVTWLNRTTLDAGDGLVEGPFLELIWPLGYFWVMHISMDITLTPGENDVLVTEFDKDSSCGFWDEYVITYTP